MSNDEEDVIFAKSALYQYLTAHDSDTKYEDIATEFGATVVSNESVKIEDTVTNMINCDNNTVLPEMKTTIVNRQLKAKKVRSLTKWTKLKNWILSVDIWKQEKVQQWYQLGYEFTEDVLNLRLLEDDDYQFLDGFSGCIHQHHANFQLDTWMENARHISVFVLVLGYGLLRSTQLRSSGEGNLTTWISDVVTVSLMVTLLLPTIIKIFSLERFKKKLATRSNLLKRCLTQCSQLASCTDKSITLIQEFEVIARGFTLITAKQSADGQVLATTQRPCPGLRKSLFLLARDIALSARQATKGLLSSYPVEELLEAGPLYLSSLPLSDYGPCVLETLPTQLEIATDQYSLGAVKGMVQVCRCHISELLRLISVCLLFHTTEVSERYADNDLCRLFDELEEFYPRLESSLLQLQVSYWNHRSQISDEPKKPTTKSKRNHVYVAVHSLNLHLRAAYKRLESLERSLEPEDVPISAVEGKVDNEDMINKEDIIADLEGVHRELAACQDCWYEAMNSVQIKHKTAATHKAVSSETEQTKTKQGDVNVKVIRDGPAHVEDEVFIGYNDGKQQDRSHSEYTGEQATMKKSHEEAIRMLNELKSIITVRAEETKQREKLALQRMAQQHTDSELDNSDQDSDHDSDPDSSDQCSDPDYLYKEDCDPDDSSSNEYSSPQSSDGEVSLGAEDKSADSSYEGEGGSEDTHREHEGFHRPVNFAFAKSLAAQAVARSQEMGALKIDIIGDNSDEG